MRADVPALARHLVRPDGAWIGWRTVGEGPMPFVILHATLSSGVQYERLASALVANGDATVLLMDRRGSGESRWPIEGPIDVGIHVDDLLAVLAAAGVSRPILLGHSFGGVLALELAGRHPDVPASVVAWEPPYAPLAPLVARPVFEAIARATAEAGALGGDAAAAKAFMTAVNGPGAWDALSPRARAYLVEQGAGAIAASALAGVDPATLRAIVAPVAILTGDASEAVYAPIADELVRRISTARRVRLPAMRHMAPITDPQIVAAAVRAALPDAAGDA